MRQTGSGGGGETNKVELRPKSCRVRKRGSETNGKRYETKKRGSKTKGK